jgi:TPR repeat protein
MSADYSFWKVARKGRVRPGLLYLLGDAGAGVGDLALLDEAAIRADVEAAFPRFADPDSEFTFDLHFERAVFSLTTYSSSPSAVIPWFREYAQRNGISMFDPRTEDIPRRDFEDAARRLRQAEQDDEAAVQRQRLPDIVGRVRLGDISAVLELGHAFFFGEGVPANQERACRLYRRAAEAGNCEGMFNLASCLQRGEGISKDIDMALQWYEKAAETDHLFAPFALGEIYSGGHGVPPNPAAASHWLRIALENGHQDAPRALRNLGVLPPLSGA